MLLSQPDRGIEVQRTPSEEDGWKVRTFKKPKGRNFERRQRFKMSLINGHLFCFTHTGIFQDNPWVNPFNGSSLKNKLVEKMANYSKMFLFHRVVKAQRNLGCWGTGKRKTHFISKKKHFAYLMYLKCTFVLTQLMTYFWIYLCMRAKLLRELLPGMIILQKHLAKPRVGGVTVGVTISGGMITAAKLHY